MKTEQNKVPPPYPSPYMSYEAEIRIEDGESFEFKDLVLKGENDDFWVFGDFPLDFFHEYATPVLKWLEGAAGVSLDRWLKFIKASHALRLANQRNDLCVEPYIMYDSFNQRDYFIFKYADNGNTFLAISKHKGAV